MSHNTRGVQESMEKLGEDTQAVLAATANLAEEKVDEARERLSDAMAAAREVYANMQKRAVASAKAADQAVRNNPYRAIGIALGAGALIGFLLSRRNRD